MPPLNKLNASNTYLEDNWEIGRYILSYQSAEASLFNIDEFAQVNCSFTLMCRDSATQEEYHCFINETFSLNLNTLELIFHNKNNDSQQEENQDESSFINMMALMARYFAIKIISEKMDSSIERLPAKQKLTISLISGVTGCYTFRLADENKNSIAMKAVLNSEELKIAPINENSPGLNLLANTQKIGLAITSINLINVMIKNTLLTNLNNGEYSF